MPFNFNFLILILATVGPVISIDKIKDIEYTYVIVFSARGVVSHFELL